MASSYDHVQLVSLGGTLRMGDMAGSTATAIDTASSLATVERHREFCEKALDVRLCSQITLAKPIQVFRRNSAGTEVGVPDVGRIIMRLDQLTVIQWTITSLEIAHEDRIRLVSCRFCS